MDTARSITRCGPARRAAGWVFLLALGAGCPGDKAPTLTFEPLGISLHFGPPGSSATHVMVTVQQGTVSGETWRIRSRVRTGDVSSERLLPEKAPSRAMDYPVSYAVVFDAPPSQPVELEVEALSREELPLGRARTTVVTKANTGVRVEVRLGRACQTDQECSNGKWCDGEESCKEGVCAPSQDPCPPSSVSCVQVSCREDARVCDLATHDDRCSPALGRDGKMHASWCHPLQGCVLNVCGDGHVDSAWEPCDDGNRLDQDGCLNTCQRNVCGDGLVNATLDAQGKPVEACDDANTNPNDACHACQEVAWHPGVILGFGPSGGDPLRLPLTYPEGLAVDRQGNLFVAEWGASRIWRVDVGGKITLVAGTGQSGYSGDNGPATSAQIAEPEDLVMDGRGNIYFSDAGNHVVRRIDTHGTITTVAGTGQPGCAGDDSAGALRTQLNLPRGLALDGQGNLYVADALNHRIRRISPGGDIATVAGGCLPPDPSPAADGGGTSALDRLDYPGDLLLEGDGSLLVAEERGHRVRRVELATGAMTTVVGTGQPGHVDGLVAQATLTGPKGLAFLPDRTVLISEFEGHRIRRLDQARRLVETWAGTGEMARDDAPVPALQAHFNRPHYMAVASDGRVYIADEFNQAVRRVDRDANRTVSTVVGMIGPVFAGYGNRALGAFMQGPNGVAVGPDGSVYVAEYEAHRVRRVYSSGVIETVLGTGEAGFNGDGRGTETMISFPDSLAMDGAGNLYITDSGNNRIRKLDAAGRVTTVAGPGEPGADPCGTLGDHGPATQATLLGPSGIAVDGSGVIVFSDAGHLRLRRIDHAGIITTVAGDCSEDYQPEDEGADALSVGIGHVYGVAVDSRGHVYLADDIHNRVREVRPDGTIWTVAGNGEPQSSGDGLPATEASLFQPGEVEILEGNGFIHLYISYTFGHRIRRVDRAIGIMETVVGVGEKGFFGDFGPGREARINLPYQLAFADKARLFITDYGNGLVRRLDLGTGQLETVAGMVHPGDGPLAVAKLTSPTALVLLPERLGWLIADGESGRVRRVDPPGVGDRLLLTVAGYPRGGTESGLAAVTHLFDHASGIAYHRVDQPVQSHVYVSERDGHVIRRLVLTVPTSPETWRVETVVGFPGEAGHVDGALEQAYLAGPAGLAVDDQRHLLYVAEVGNHDVRAIQLESPAVGTPLCLPVPCITTVAGTPGLLGFYGEGVPAKDALFDSPEALAVSTEGDLYVADTGNHRVRRVPVGSSPVVGSGSIATVLGDGSPNSSGEGAPARYFPVDTPRGIAVDGFGNVFVSSRNTVRVIAAGPDGHATGEDGVQTIYGAPPRDVFPQSVTRCLGGVAVEPGESNVLVVDSCQGFLMELTRQ